jgi:hypothetical protein
VQPLVPHVVHAGRRTSVHVAVPLQVRTMQSVDVHVSGVPAQPDPPQTSPNVQALPSSHASLVRHCQTPPRFVQR